MTKKSGISETKSAYPPVIWAYEPDLEHNGNVRAATYEEDGCIKYYSSDYLEARMKTAIEALEFYAQMPLKDDKSEFGKSCEVWGESCATWEPLIDLGDKAREALATLKEKVE